MRKIFVALGAWLTVCAMSPPKEVDELMPDAQLIGAATYKKAIFKLYDAALWAPSDKFEWDAPFALSLTYRRTFRAERLANASIIEMARLTGKSEEDFEDARAPLTSCFADVDKGDVITGYSIGPDAAAFYYNGEKRCDIDYPNFRQAFFGIWLSDASRAPDKALVLKGDNR